MEAARARELALDAALQIRAEFSTDKNRRDLLLSDAQAIHDWLIGEPQVGAVKWNAAPSSTGSWQDRDVARA